MFQAQPRALFYTIVSHSRTSFNGGAGRANARRHIPMFLFVWRKRIAAFDISSKSLFFWRASARRHTSRCSFLFGASVLPRLIFLPNRYFFWRASARRHLRDDILSQALLLSRAPIFLKSQTYIALCCPLLLSLTLRRHCLMLYIEIQGRICYNILYKYFFAILL